MCAQCRTAYYLSKKKNEPPLPHFSQKPTTHLSCLGCDQHMLMLPDISKLLKYSNIMINGL